MRLLDIVNGPWAILPEVHAEIQDIYKRHLKGDKIDVKAMNIEKRDPLASASLLAASSGRKVESRGTYTVIDQVAIIPVHDAIAKRMTWFMDVCGGCSSEIFSRDFSAAQNDSKVKAIIPYFDTPGGTVDGTAEAAAVMAKFRGNKPVIGFSDGMICSAGYWMAAACDEIYISSDTNPIGSIGVVAAHVDVSKRMEMFGQRVTEITAGDYKRVASSYEPLSEAGLAYIQGQLNHIYTAFTDFVADQRPLRIEDHKIWADGQVFLGSQAINVGLVDGVSTLDDLIDKLAAGKHEKASPRGTTKTKTVASQGGTARTLQEGKTMTKEELKAQHPELYQAVLDEGEQAGKQAAATESAAATETAVAQANSQTTEQLQALCGAVFGAEAGDKFAKVVASGVTAEQITALGGLVAPAASEDSADASSRAGILAALQQAGNQPLKTGNLSSDPGAEGEQDFMGMVAAYKKEHACSSAQALSAVAKAHPQAHAAYIKTANKEKE